MNDNPRWFWKALFEGGGFATFYADNKTLAWDHAERLASDFNKSGVRTVMRLKHEKDVSPAENQAAGMLL